MVNDLENNIISGLLVPSKGHIRFDGQDVTHLQPEERNIAQVFQFPVIYDTMTVRQNLAFPLRNRGVEPGEVDRRVRETAEMLELDHMLERRAAGLTADGKQKISLGRGVIRSDVNVIMFDEPLTVIDPHMKWALRTQLKSLHRQFGHTMIYVTHDQTEALTFADKVVVMHDGRVVQIGTPEELFEKPAHTFVGYFIGSPGMNLFPARIDGSRAYVNGSEIDLGRGYGQPKGNVQIGVRPEYLKLSSKSGLPVNIRRVEDVGRHQIVRAEFFGHDINIVAPEGTPVGSDMTRVDFVPGKINVYADDWRIDGEAA